MKTSHDPKRHTSWGKMAVYACFILSSSSAWAGVTDPTRIITEPPLSLPTPRVTYNDPAFGTPTVRVAAPQEFGSIDLRPEYSELQAWNTDMSLLLLNSGLILDAKTFTLLHTVDFMFPASGNGLRWSPTDPLSLFYLGKGLPGCSGAAFTRYKLIPGSPMQGQPQVVHCFPEYIQFDKNASFQEMSINGQYVGLVGVRSDGMSEAFIYDVLNNVKHSVFILPKGLEWIQPSPLGNYAIINWGGGGEDRFNGLESFDFEMNFIGKVSTGHGHGGLAVDKNGVEYYVDFSPDNFVGVTGPLIKKNRIPKGYDDWKAGDKTGVVSLLRIDWGFSMHISCLAWRSGWCVGEMYGDAFDGVSWLPFQQEIVRIYLDGTEAAPHVERLAHHRSKPDSTAADGCTNSNYWAQPHATVSPNGTKAIFGSNWGRICDLTQPVDAFQLTLTPADPIPPSPPTGLRIP